MSDSTPYVPPRPHSLAALPALLRVLWNGDGNLLELLPAAAYRFESGNLGYSRRSTVLFNDPALVRGILRDEEGIFPKSDLMVNALEPLIGESIFVTDGDKWRRQRAMIDPAFTHMRISLAFGAMRAAVDGYETYLVLREELSQFLTDNGVFQDTLWYVDLLTAQVYAGYICAQGGVYLRADFSSPHDPLEHTRRMLGLDGVRADSGRTRLKSIDGESHVIDDSELDLGASPGRVN